MNSIALMSQWLLFIEYTAAAIFFLLYFFVCVYLAKKYDPYFPKFVNSKYAYENSFSIFSPVLRGLRYAGCIFFKDATTKRTYCRYFFEGYDFRGNATFIDKLLAMTFLGSFFLVGIIGGLLYILNHF